MIVPFSRADVGVTDDAASVVTTGAPKVVERLVGAPARPGVARGDQPVVVEAAAGEVRRAPVTATALPPEPASLTAVLVP